MALKKNGKARAISRKSSMMWLSTTLCSLERSTNVQPTKYSETLTFHMVSSEPTPGFVLEKVAAAPRLQRGGPNTFVQNWPLDSEFLRYIRRNISNHLGWCTIVFFVCRKLLKIHQLSLISGSYLLSSSYRHSRSLFQLQGLICRAPETLLATSNYF